MERGVDQRAGVGLLRAGEHLLGRPLLHHLALAHHHHAVGDGADDREVVRDEEHGEAEALLEIGQQVEDLGADGDIEGGNGLVEDDQLRPGDEGAGDGEALALAAGKLVRVFAGVVRRQADLDQRGLDAGLALGVGERLGQEMQRLGDDAAGAVAGIEGAVGILEHHLHAAAQGRQRRAVRPVTSVPSSRIAPPSRGLQRQHGAGQRGLAAAGFADEADALAGPDREVHAVDGAQAAARARRGAGGRGGIRGRGRAPPAAVRRPGGRGHAPGWAVAGRRQQRAGVGVLGALEEAGGRPGLDDLALAHHGDAVGHRADDREVVADEDEAGALLGDEVAQQRRGSAPAW